MANDNEDAEVPGGTSSAGGTDSMHAGLSKAERRVVDKLLRARHIATLVCPDEEEPDLDDLIELAEMISEEGG